MGREPCFDAPEVDQVWQRKPPLKQRFRVYRVWVAGPGLLPDEPEIAGQVVVGLLPLNGGRDLISTVPELHGRCFLVDDAGAASSQEQAW